MIAERAGMRQRHDGIFEWGLGRTEAKRAADRAVRAGAGRARQDDKHRCRKSLVRAACSVGAVDIG